MQTLTRNRTVHLLLLALLVSPAGCFSLSHSAPPQQHYVLGGGGPPGLVAPPADQPVADPNGRLIGIRSPRLADYLTTPFIVVRRGSHRIEFAEYHRWGEDLGRAINRTVAVQLAALAPPHRVEVAPWPGGTSPGLVIQLQVLRFEGVAQEGSGTGEGEAHLLATWEILRSLDGAVLGRGTTEVREPGWAVGDYDGLVGLLDASLEALARDLALSLDRAGEP